MSGFGLSVLFTGILLGTFPVLFKAQVKDLEPVLGKVRGSLHLRGELYTLAHDLRALRKVLRRLLWIGVLFFFYLGFVIALLVGADALAATGRVALAPIHEVLKGIHITPIDRLIAIIILALGLLGFYFQALKPWFEGRRLARRARCFLERRSRATGRTS